MALVACTATCSQILALPDRQAVPNYECSPQTSDIGCACVAGFADCDGDLANGCEVKLASDDRHCGKCNNDCKLEGHCSDGQCRCGATTCSTDECRETSAGPRCICDSETWPTSAPAVADGSSKLDLVFAMRSFGFERDDGVLAGYDLDGYCTGCDCPQDDSKDTCKQRFEEKNIADGNPLGIDNAAAGIITTALAIAKGETIEQLSKEMDNGAWSVLFRVRDYSGEANDPEVRVAIYAGRSFSSDPCNGAGSKPKWDGTDPWPVRADSLKGSASAPTNACGDTLGLSYDKPRFEDTKAFVSGGHLTATWPDNVTFFIAGAADGIGVELHQAVFTAKLERDPAGNWRLSDGLFGGGWPEKALFKSVSATKISGKPLCTNDPSYSTLKNLICRNEDVRTEKGGPTSLCNALSFAIAFDAQLVKLGSVIPPESATAGCPPALDPAHDDCAN
jgi:hypothetical protein